MLLKKLTEAAGVSGNESEVRNIIIDEIKDYVEEYRVDNMGNILFYKKGRKQGDRKIMLAAHMDEVGLMVKHIDSMGLIKFHTVGGIDKRILVSKPVLIGENKIPGVIGAKPIHLQRPNERRVPLNIDELYVDIGAKSKEDAEKYVSLGDYVVFDSDYVEFGDNRVKAKALDDRVGCSLMIDLIKKNEDLDFYGAFTTMEEIGLRGAGPAAYQIKPDYALILEGTLCYEMPELDEHLIPTKLGHGPAISLLDRTTIYNVNMRKEVENIAKEFEIPWQYRTTSMGGNDSGPIHLNEEGCITTTISVPCRNIHSQTSVMDKGDYENTYKLVEKIISSYNEGEI